MAVKKKSEDAGYQALRRDLSAGTLGSLYIFHGEEVYLRDHYLGEMKKQLLTGGLDDFNYHVLTGRDFTLQRLRELVDAMPMLSERTMVVVYDWDIFKGDREGMETLLSDLPDYLCLIFVYDAIPYRPDGRVKLGKLLKEKGREVEFVRQSQDELTRWVVKHFHALGRDIATEDARYLIFLCGDLMTTLNAEIGKIAAYAKGQRVTRADIDAVAIPVLDAVVFQLTDAIAAGDFDKAFSVLSDLLHMGEAPIKLLSVLGRQLRQLYTARLALEGRKGTKWLMELWGMKSSYPAEKLMTSARKFSLGWCRRAVTLCEEADLAMKSTGADGGELLTGLLLEISRPVARPQGVA